MPNERPVVPPESGPLIQGRRRGVQITFWLDPDVKQNIRRAALFQHKSQSQFVLDAAVAAMERVRASNPEVFAETEAA